MNNTLLIASESPETAEEYKGMLSDSKYTIAIFTPLTPLLPAIADQLSLIIVPDCDISSLPSLIDLQIPRFIPVLALGKHNTPPPVLRDEESTRLIDYLGGQPDAESLKARIEFLQKVAKLGFEHDSYLKNHDTFLEWFTSRDGLTGLYNRHHLNKTLDAQYRNAEKNGTELSILIIDIDYFNDINKNYGQSFGDFVLNEMSARLTDATRREDICYRLSGGDFVVLMPGADLQTARGTARKILARCETKPFSRKTIERTVTLSAGVASLTTHRPSSVDEFVNMAETALFKAKADGRNRAYTYAPREGIALSSPKIDFDSIKVTIHRILEKTRNSAISSLQLLARDIAGPNHKEHLERVVQYTELFCKQLGLPPPIIKTLQNAAILHTSIRYLIHNDLLSKQERFSMEDFAMMKDFPYKLSEVVQIFDYFSQERLILLTRSEKFDGSGYPEGLRGDEIPLGARIISIIDSFAAMEGDRPYRPRLAPEFILQELKNEAGKQFDPFLVLKLLDIIELNKLLNTSGEDIAEIRAELLSKFAKS